MHSGIFVFYFHFRKKGAGGQIATLFTLMIAVLFLFIAITANLGKVSHIKTMTANAADGAALQLASMLGSYGKAIKKQANNKEDGCDKVDLGKVLLGVADIAIIIVGIIGTAYGQPWGPKAIEAGVVGLAAWGANQYIIYPDQIAAINKKLSKLPPIFSFREAAIQYALIATIEDPNTIDDVYDWNGNKAIDDDEKDSDDDGDITDKVPRFQSWYVWRTRNYKNYMDELRALIGVPGTVPNPSVPGTGWSTGSGILGKLSTISAGYLLIPYPVIIDYGYLGNIWLLLKPLRWMNYDPKYGSFPMLINNLETLLGSSVFDAKYVRDTAGQLLSQIGDVRDQQNDKLTYYIGTILYEKNIENQMCSIDQWLGTLVNWKVERFEDGELVAPWDYWDAKMGEIYNKLVQCREYIKNNASTIKVPKGWDLKALSTQLDMGIKEAGQSQQMFKAISKIIGEIKSDYDTLNAKYANMIQINPVEYTWNDSLGEHKVKVEVGSFKMPYLEVYTKGFGNSKTCYRMYDHRSSVPITVSRSDQPSRSKVGKVGERGWRWKFRYNDGWITSSATANYSPDSISISGFH